MQAGYKAQTLSAFLGTAAPKAAPAIDFIKPLTPAEERTSSEFFNILNFVLRFCPTDPSGAAVLGIYGNSKLEAMYPTYYVDEAKQS